MNKEKRGQLTKAPEFRSYTTKFEVRSPEESVVDSHIVTLRGYASMTEKPYSMYDAYGDYDEMISRGAFKKTLSERADVAFLLNHEGLTMARTMNGTLRLNEDEVGLGIDADLDSRRSDVGDLLMAIERGDVTEMSFAFKVLSQDWDANYDKRTIREVSLDRGDVSAVNYGANPNTVIAARAFPHARDAQLARLASALEDGDQIDPAQRTQLARMVRALPAKDSAVLADVAEDLTGYNLALALKAMLAND
mgnify:CR=1 FL=1